MRGDGGLAALRRRLGVFGGDALDEYRAVVGVDERCDPRVQASLGGAGSADGEAVGVAVVAAGERAQGR